MLRSITMKIIRYLTTAGRPDYGLLHSDGRTTRLTGDLYGQLADTGEPAAVAKLLAPIEPRDIRHHLHWPQLSKARRRREPADP